MTMIFIIEENVNLIINITPPLLYDKEEQDFSR